MIENGWFAEAIKQPSPHFNRRPDREDVSLLIIHNISLPPGNFTGQYVEAFFCGELDFQAHPDFEALRDLKVSSHLYIRRNGDLVQFVDLYQRAWHAGVSVFEGRENCNDYSIGIELAGTDDLPYTPEQYECLHRVTRQLLAEFPLLTPARITGHQDIAPGRKTDPGDSFDWQAYLGRI